MAAMAASSAPLVAIIEEIQVTSPSPSASSTASFLRRRKAMALFRARPWTRW